MDREKFIEKKRLEIQEEVDFLKTEIGRAHVWTPVTPRSPSRMPSSAWVGSSNKVVDTGCYMWYSIYNKSGGNNMNKYDKLQSKLMKYQTKIYHITLKYDPTTSVDNYQELSIFWLDNMTTLDKIRIKWYAKRTLGIVSELRNIATPPKDYEE